MGKGRPELQKVRTLDGRVEHVSLEVSQDGDRARGLDLEVDRVKVLSLEQDESLAKDSRISPEQQQAMTSGAADRARASRRGRDAP